MMEENSDQEDYTKNSINLQNPTLCYSPIQRGSPKASILPTIHHRSKEKGGGGLIYPGAQSRLLDILKSPRYNENLNDKLLHNSRIHSYFHADTNHKGSVDATNMTPINRMIQKLKTSNSHVNQGNSLSVSLIDMTIDTPGAAAQSNVLMRQANNGSATSLTHNNAP